MRTADEIISEILIKRDIVERDEREEFLSDKPKLTHDPFLLSGMREGVDLLLSEIEKGTKICIYGDYDADGVTSSCIWSCGLKHLTDNFTIYIPSRFTEGYGLNKDAIKRLSEDGVGLIITVDCGCVSYKEVEYAKSLGMKVIVTDHHNIEDVMADCIVIDPKRKDCQYPNKYLAGCGVAFKFLQALQRTVDLPKSILTEVLDLVAVGTVGDIVPLKDENRTMVKYGISVINSGKRRALRKLIDAISIGNVNSEGIAFGIVPHINAAGRMASAMKPVELFLTEDESEMDLLVDELVEYNIDRKATQEEAYLRCEKLIDGSERFIVLRMDDIHEGIAGIAAGKVKDDFYRPVIIVTPSGEGYLKGTGRSIPKVNIYEVLNGCSELFERFGGHKSASGFLMKEQNLPKLICHCQNYMAELESRDSKLFERLLEFDTHIEPDEMTVELAKALEKLGPFGEGNPSPVLALKGVRLSRVTFMGERSTHARFTAVKKSMETGGIGYASCVLFRKAQEMSEILFTDKAVDLYGSINYQIWNGQERIQFIVEEIKECS